MSTWVDRVYAKVKQSVSRGTKKKGRRYAPITPLPTPLAWAHQRRLDFFRDAMGYLSNNRIDGVYTEFGCHTALTFRFALNTIGDPSQTANRIHRFYAFDSFEGLPDPKGKDKQSVWEKGKLKTSIESFQEKCRLDLHRIAVIPGFFCDSLKGMEWPSEEQIAMAYVDCDLYESCCDVLPFLGDKMAHGGLLAFDDFYCFYGDPERGEQKSFQEWQATVPHLCFVPFLRYGWFGMSFIVLHKDRQGMEG